MSPKGDDSPPKAVDEEEASRENMAGQTAHVLFNESQCQSTRKRIKYLVHISTTKFQRERDFVNQKPSVKRLHSKNFDYHGIQV